MTCQLRCIDEIKKKNSFVDDLFQMRVRILRRAKRTGIFLRNKLVHLVMGRTRGLETYDPEQPAIGPGEMVRVRSRKEIRNMLDDHERYKGCLFIDEMYEHCDKTYRVLKTVDVFFDEALQKVCRCKDTVILENVVCSGRQRLYSVSCDRNCFFFWHKAWIRKIS